jgi:ABC-type amino acid transport substrate-binding protein
MRLPALQLLIISVINYSSANLLSINQSTPLSKGITLLVQSSKHSKVINFIIDETRSSHDIMNEVLSAKTFSFPVQIENFQTSVIIKLHKKVFSVLFVNSFEAILKFCNEASHENFHFNGFFVLILDDVLMTKIKNIFEIFWMKFIFNVNVLVKSENSENLSIFTFDPFSGELCGDLTPVKINEFDSRTLKWTTDVHFPKKLHNLKKCPIKVGSLGSLFGVMVKVNSDKTQHYFGFEVDCLNELASKLNFTLIFKIFPYEVGLILKNKTGTGMIKRVQEKQVDLICGSFSLQQQRRELLSDTRSFYSDKMILVVPKAEVIGFIEKLLLPFDYYTWISLAVVLIIAFCIVALLKVLPPKYHNFMIGKNIDNNYFNILNVLLGGSQKKVPFRNFARFLLMSFILLTLILRSSYLGSLFNILKNDMFSRDISSIEELDRLGFTFHVYESLALRLKGEKGMKR